MNKKHFIELADSIREWNTCEEDKFTDEQIGRLADFCANQNHSFNRARWIDYIAGVCGPNGGNR